VTYAWLSQGLIASVSLFAWTELAQRVRTGDIAVDLARPVDLQLAWLAADLGRAAFVLIPRGAPPMLVGALTTGLFLPRTPWPYLLGLLSLVLGVVVSFACRFAVNLLAFWLTEIRGLIGFYAGLTAIFCGLLVPISWFPDWLRALAWATPFPAMMQVPLDVLAARVDVAGAVRLLAVQVIWVAATLLAGRGLLRLATRRLVVQGG
jgi:ABC-2 type transport system permease protein